MTAKIVTLDGGPRAALKLSVETLKVASQQTGQSGEAARAALKAFEREVADGGDETEAAMTAVSVLKASFTSLREG